MNSYEEKQKNRAERYRGMAAKARDESGRAKDSAEEISSGIPLGQPILVGHYSEARHRRDLEKIHNGFKKSSELMEKAEYYEEKARAVENNKAISSDDPDAIKKLKEKLAKLEEKHAILKAHNKKNPGTLPWYALPYSSAAIRSTKKRIAKLEALHAREEKEYEVDGVTFLENVSENRIQLMFGGKPSEEIRAKLKKAGFKWSPRNGVWQNYLKDINIQIAKRIVEGIR